MAELRTMRAVTIPEPGGRDALRVDTVDVPDCPPGHALVRVAAAGVNRADIAQREGTYQPPAGATQIPGLEVAGTVVSVNPGDAAGGQTGSASAADSSFTAVQIGDRVAALLTGGGYAEYVPVPIGQLMPIPTVPDPHSGAERPMSFTEAAALPEVMATVYSNLFTTAGLQPGEWVLIHGGGSGIGTAAIQMAKAHGAKPAVTVGSERKADFCRRLGADAVINYREEDFVDRIKQITADAGQPDSPNFFGLPRDSSRRPGADVILDIMGAAYLERNTEALTRDGRLVVISLQGGAKAELNLGRLMVRRQTVIATTLRARSEEQKAAVVTGLLQDFWPHVASGRITPVVYRELPIDDVAEAHRLLEDGEAIGKVILKVGAHD